MEDYNLWLTVIAKGYDVANLLEILSNVGASIQMYMRRKKLEYIKSQYTLAKLDVNLCLQSFSVSYVSFLLRTLPRLLPRISLGKFYFLLENYADL